MIAELSFRVGGVAVQWLPFDFDPPSRELLYFRCDFC